MPLKIACPWCRTVAVVPDAMRGQVSKCSRCGKLMQLGPAPVHVTTPKPPPVPPPAPIHFKKEDAPRAARKPAAPPPRRRPDEEDDYDDRPARPRRRREEARGVSPAVWVRCGVGGLAVVMVLLVVLVRALNPASATAQATQAPIAEQRAEAPLSIQNQEIPAPQQGPAVVPEPEEPPQGPLPAHLSREALAKVKKATVYVRAQVRGGVSQGTGFFAVEKGVVVTNAHVLNMLDSTQRPARIDVVCDSGEPTERTLAAQLLAANRNPDLAVLRVQGLNLPEPLPVRSAKYLTELQKVYVFGFPFGEQLGKDITVSESSVSSLRKHAGSDVLKEVQVNGGMQPGNSGGPVVDTSGHVVGVAVSIIRGTQINFAIPGEEVRSYLRDLLGPRR